MKYAKIKRKMVSMEYEVPLLLEVDKLAKAQKISRQKLINLILRQAMEDPNFVIKIPTKTEDM